MAIIADVDTLLIDPQLLNDSVAEFGRTVHTVASCDVALDEPT
jgi:hypothetical protein